MKLMTSLFSMSLLVMIFLIPFLASLLIILYFWYEDKYEREPLSLVLKMFIWGATSAIFGAIILEYLAIMALELILPPEILAIVIPVIVAPIAEEYSKGKGILLMRGNEEYEGMMDGLVYGVAIGAGFGLTENILYGLNALVFGGLLATVLLVIIRSSLEIVGHPFFTGWIGSEVGLEKMYGHGGFGKGYLLAVVFHAIWNSIAIIGSINETLSISLLGLAVIVYFFLMHKRMARALQLDRECMKLS